MNEYPDYQYDEVRKFWKRYRDIVKAEGVNTEQAEW